MTVELGKLHGPALPMKFKVIVKDTGQVLEPQHICMNVLYDIVRVDNDDYRFESVEVIQSIGRKDMDGVEVFHGDVLVFGKAGFVSAERAAVRWDILGMNLRLVTANGGTFTLDLCDKGRVIGNVFANPELMSSKQEEQDHV